MGRIRQFIQDADRRRVLSNAALYIVAAWVVIQVADLAIDAGVLRWPLRNVFVATTATTEVIRLALAGVHSPETRSSLVIALSAYSSSAGCHSP